MENHVSGPSTETQKPFTPPRHWVGPEELNESYWKDPKIQEKRAQEFYEKPIEWLESLDKSPEKAGMARRDFLTIMGASMAMAGAACARRPVHKIIPYVVKPEEITPGISAWYASTYFDGAGTPNGILIRTREGRPVKLEGNPDHPVNRGRLSPRGQASLLELYDPDRIQAPFSRQPGSLASQPLSWQEVDSAIVSKLKSANHVRVLTGAVQSPSTDRLIREFIEGVRDGQHVQYEVLSHEEISEAQEQSYGAAVIPHYRFDQAEAIVSLSADFLGTWISPVEFAADWAKGRKLDSKNAAHAKLSKFFVFESAFTNTGASADERYPIRPGDELKIALAIAHELASKHGLAQLSSASATLAGYAPAKVAEEIGVPGLVEAIGRAAQALAEARGKSLVVAGGLQAKTRDAVALQVAVNLINSALGNEGITVDGTVNAQPARGSFGAVSRLIQEMNSGSVDVLIVHRTNPVFTLGSASKAFEDAMKKVPLVVVIAERDNETAAFAHYVLPDHHFLENWGDANPRKGVYSLQQPAISPLHSSRAFQDSLISWSKTIRPGAGLAGRSADWHAYLQESWKETVFREMGSGSFEAFWETTLQKGVIERPAGQPSARGFRGGALSLIPAYAAAQGEMRLALYSNVSMLDGRHANNAWLQELPDPVSSVTWDNYASISPELAAKFELKNDDVVEIASGDQKIKLPVRVQPGVHPTVVCVAVGYGRQVEGKVGKGTGVNVYPFVQTDGGKAVFSGQAATLRKTGEFYRLAATQWHTTSENRPIINDITLAEFRKDPATANHVDPHLRLKEVPTMWPQFEYNSYRWGMAIDLNSCMGCNACMIACQAENNIPVVGRDQVRVGRQMHWIRIDRYYAGTPQNPDVVFQPMLCQHCENAPCETVCPVIATAHDDEGLNVQVYNRCVGTRYCQNNCPYKVRRFNYFDHWKAYEGTMNLVWNPDITVRSRGIMEKCTFCMQRIREAKDHAKTAGERVKDGTLKTACQQTCPTDAIVFGDMNDPESRVSKLRTDERAFRVLEVLNTRPSISYMTKVRNKEGAAHHGDAHH